MDSQSSLGLADASYSAPHMPSLITNRKQSYARVRESKLSGRQSNALVCGSLRRKVIDREFNEKTVTEGYFTQKIIIFVIEKIKVSAYALINDLIRSAQHRVIVIRRLYMRRGLRAAFRIRVFNTRERETLKIVKIRNSSKPFAQPRCFTYEKQ